MNQPIASPPFRISALAIALLSSCSNSGLKSSGRLSANWTAGQFRIAFQAGPHQNRESFSYYQIQFTSEDGVDRTLVMESGQSIDGLQSVADHSPKAWINIIEDPAGNAIIIEEQVPNDCCPHANYLWVRIEPEGYFTGTYLQLPARPNGSLTGVFSFEFPNIQSLENDLLTYTYPSEKIPARQKLSDIRQTEKPRPPG